MGKVTIKIKSPYTVTLFVDNKQYSSDGDNIFVINLSDNVMHTLKIFVKNQCSDILDLNKRSILQKISISKFSEWNNLFYTANFSIKGNSKLILAYKKRTIKDPLWSLFPPIKKNELLIPYFEIQNIKGLKIQYENNNIFETKISLFYYILYRKFMSALFYVFIICFFCFTIFDFYIDYINDVQKYSYALPAASPKEGMIVYGLIFFFILIVFIFDMALFLKQTKELIGKFKNKSLNNDE